MDRLALAKGVISITTHIRRIASRFSDLSLKVKFMLFYILLVLLPMVFFLQWYSQTLMRDRQSEIRYEKQQLLEQSVRVFNNQLLETESVNSTLQSNAFLLKLLQNGYYTPSDEVYSYLTDVMPTITGICVAHPMIDEAFIYRYKDSALSKADLIYYIVNIKEFAYDRKLLDEVKTSDFVWFAEMDPAAARHNTAKTTTLSPKLICLSKLYDAAYSKVVGVVELQVRLDRLMESMNFFLPGESLYLKIDGEYYPVNFNSSKRVQYDKPGAAVSAAGGYGLVAVGLGGTNMEFVYRYRDADMGSPVMLSSLMTAALLLILPTMLLLLYLYHFTGRLAKFSSHIKLAHGENLKQYKENASRDEFGVVVSEYNRMTQTITKLIRSVLEAETQKHEANYYAMQSQVNPHFLFNTLENIRMRTEMKEYDGVSDMLFALSRLLRYNITMRSESTLLSEFEHIRHYLRIYQYRRKNMVRYAIDIPEGFEDVECPFCILQPIVENCFRHGMKNAVDAITIEIALRNEEAGVVVEIRDNGAGMPDEKLRDINASLATGADIATSGDRGSVGLKNVNSRLRFFYGEQYGISFAPNRPRGLVCRMRLGRRARFDPRVSLAAEAEDDDPSNGQA